MVPVRSPRRPALPRPAVLLAAVALALLLVGCGDEPAGDAAGEGGTPTATPGDDATASPTADPTPDETAWQTCENQVAGYAVEYPPDWVANEGDELMDACTVFDTPPLELPDAPQDLSLDYGVSIHVDNVPFATATGEDAGATVETAEETEVDGLPAVRQEAVGTGEGLIPEGLETTRWFVDLRDATLIASSFDAGEPPYGEKVRVLDRMMASMELADGE